MKFVTTTILHFHLTPVVTARLQLLKYVTFNPQQFRHVTLAFLMAFASYVIALSVEIISLYMVSLMTDMLDVIQNFIQFEIILIFSEKAINLYKNSPVILAIQ